MNEKEKEIRELALTPEQVAMIEESIAAKESGVKPLSADEVMRLAREKIQSWLPEQSA